jgi:cell division protein FtsQ
MRRRAKNSVNDRLSRREVAKRRLRRSGRPLALGLVGVAVVVAVVIGVRAVDPSGTIVSVQERFGEMMARAGLRVNTVVIEGRQTTPEPLLRAALGVGKGDPILGFSLDQARQRIEELGWIEQATVERRLPDTVVVIIKERRPFAIWQSQGKYQLVDRAGQPVAGDPSKFRHLPLIAGIGAPSRATPILDAIAQRPTLSDRIEGLGLVGERRWNLVLKNKTQVLLPEGHEIAAIDRLIELHQLHALMDRPLARIDLREADKFSLRPRIETPTPTPAPATTRRPT